MIRTIVFILCFHFASSMMFGQDTTSTNGNEKRNWKNCIKSNLVGAIGGQYQVGFERKIKEDLSVQLSGGYVTNTLNEFIISGTSSGFILVPEVRYFFSNEWPGMYVAAAGRYRNVLWDFNENFDESQYYGENIDWSFYMRRVAIGGAIIGGYQMVLKNGIAIELFVGPQFKSVRSRIRYKDPNFDTTDFSSYSPSDFLDKDGVGVRAGFTLGYAF